MARGWESKSIEAQIDAAETDQSAVLRKTHTPEEIEKIRRRESLLLSLKRVNRELDEARNPRYRAVLEKALADLNAQIAAVD
jgi:hypothetical protein